MDKRFQVFVSSTYNDLIEERKEATQAILKCNCFPAGMELFPASNKKQWNVIKQVIDDSDFYLLILAGRYGSLGTNDAGIKIGYTEMEFDYALSEGKPIIAMLHRSPETLPAKLTEKTEVNIKRLEKFRDKAMSGRMVAFWENKDQLNGEILNSLHKMMNSTPEAVGWIRANTISEVDEAKEPDLSLVIEEFANIKDAEDRVYYLEELQYGILPKCFSNRLFIKEFAGLMNINLPSRIIRDAFELIPYHLERKARKYLLNAIDIKSLFLMQCKDGKIENTKLATDIIRFLRRVEEYSLDYSEPMLATLKAKNCSPEQKQACIDYIDSCRLYRRQTDEGKCLYEYILCEFDNESRILSIADLADLLVTICDNEKSFVTIYNLFKKSDRTKQGEIICSIVERCGLDIYMVTPQIQRMFLDMCETVYSWGDDKLTSDLLLYCLFTRTYDIFTVDEIFEQVDKFNDDVFYLFFWGVGYGELGMGIEETYDLDDDEKGRITEIIKSRNHPREEKLLEHLYR